MAVTVLPLLGYPLLSLEVVVPVAILGTYFFLLGKKKEELGYLQTRKVRNLKFAYAKKETTQQEQRGASEEDCS